MASTLAEGRAWVTPEYPSVQHAIRGLTCSTVEGRVSTGRKIAAAVAFLLCDDAAYITGAQLAVDGGFLA